MRNLLIDQILEDGFTVIDDFLSADEVTEMLEAGQNLHKDAPKEERKVFSAAVGTTASQNKDRYFIESGNKIRYFFEEGAVGENGELLVDPSVALNKVGHYLHVDHPVFSRATFSNRVKEVCWQLGFRKPAVAQSMYIFKNPGIGGEVKPHQDATYLSTEPSTTIGFWIPLEDATLQNGCLHFIKGSHKSGVHRRYIRNPDSASDELLVYDRPAPLYPQSNFVSAPVKAGSLVLIHSQVVHRSDANRSTRSRHAYTFHVIETEKCQYSPDNWLQPPADQPFPVLYERD
ncbi:phytanoyl-CoA dioxygenase domain-containing protein 1 [Uranotaenia lowii]|uniref:phytanoyl-CoA dioxygenase domain-containing protein 1 n=1 Tax=Uranotaenia lowii TaxID=190385 RepID=UPI00247ABB66|nr:phytanoyl-CoA dioxygenase domain-containing protein 1 [Uranotaenia lowii]